MLVRVYVEKPRKKSSSSVQHHHHHHYHIHQTLRQEVVHVPPRQGYDRRAGLLAYSHLLRQSARGASSTPLLSKWFANNNLRCLPSSKTYEEVYNILFFYFYFLKSLMLWRFAFWPIIEGWSHVTFSYSTLQWKWVVSSAFLLMWNREIDIKRWAMLGIEIPVSISYTNSYVVQLKWDKYTLFF